MKRRFLPLRILILVIICAIQLVPLYISFTQSVKTKADETSKWALPGSYAWQNYPAAIEQSHLMQAFLNTVIITVSATLLVVLVAAAAAYPLARNTSKLNRAVTIFILSIMMIPAMSLLVPLYVLLVKMRVISTYWGIIPIHMVFNLPLAIFMFVNFTRSIPTELDEAALIDGCSIYRIFWSIILPLLKPVTASVIIFTAVQVWNDFQYSLFFLQKPSMHVISLSIASFFGMTSFDLNVASAAAILAVLPILVLYLFLQRYFVKGMVESGIK